MSVYYLLYSFQGRNVPFMWTWLFLIYNYEINCSFPLLCLSLHFLLSCKGSCTKFNFTVIYRVNCTLCSNIFFEAFYFSPLYMHELPVAHVIILTFKDSLVQGIELFVNYTSHSSLTRKERKKALLATSPF